MFPVRSDEDVSNWSRISRDGDECEWDEIGFDIPEADDGTEYVLIAATFDRPRLQWYSRHQFKDRFRHDPLDSPRPQGVDPDRWEKQAENQLEGRTESTIRLTPDRVALLKRIAQLWNGEEVCDVHLLADQCPTISDLTADLDENEIKRLYYNTNFGWETLLAFGDADWFDVPPGFLKSTSVFRKQAWYDLDHKAQSLINGRDEFPDLRGDPYGGLVHWITIGLVCLYDQIRG